MAQKKRGKKLFRWSKSELPDNDANTQVLLLGVTRLDTPPRTSPPKFIKPKRPHTYHATTTTTTTPSIYEDRNDRTTVTEAIDDIERQLLIKTVVHRQYNSNRSLCDQEQQQPTKVTVAALNWPASTKSKRNLNSILGRFNRNSSEKDIKDIDIVTARFIERERPPLIVEPSPPRHASPTAKRSSHLDDCRVKKSKKSARLSSCIPYCTRRHEPSDGPSDSLASSFHLVECCTSSKNSRKLRRNSFYHHDNPQRQYLIDQLKRLRSSNELIASNTSNRLMNKRGHQQQPQQGQRGGSNNNSNLFNNLNIMDRSVDSIGSCSLDVDAESTDFSDTSGSLNVCTPLSGKDFTREFTSRIHERCQLPLHAQQTKTILDPNSGKITTIISPPAPVQLQKVDDIPSPQAIPPAKKPSYLNLACCVNGYSNLTTYDSKFRQSINKSREVSPIRPITHTVQYNRSDNHYLVVPVPIPINDHRKTASMMDAHTILSSEKRFYAQQSTITTTTTTTMNSMSGRDITDNINTNGCTKSFIQQRVERLYGPEALAQGLYSPKKPKQFEENGVAPPVSLSSILVENSSKFNGHTAHTTFTTNGSSMMTTATGRLSDVENVNADEAPLPVLRHLRPEFRAQLPMLSPKRTTPVKVTLGDIVPATTTSPSNNGKYDCRNGIDVSPSNGVGSKTTTNGCISTAKYRIVNTDGDTDDDDDNDENSLTSTKRDTECSKVNRHTAKNGSNSHNTSVTEIMNSMNKLHCNDVERSHGDTTNGQTLMATASVSKSTPVVRKSIDKSAVPTTATAAKTVESDTNGNHKTETKDAQYFLDTVHAERDRLIGLAVDIEKDLDELMQKNDIEEEVLGQLRSAAGKARLLATKKFKQFEGLCLNSLNQTSSDSFAPPTPQDLEGFWEMVLLQVTHVDALYAEHVALKANNWKKPEQEKPVPQGPRAIKRPTGPRVSSAPSTALNAKKSATAIAAAQKREEHRKKLMEMKRQHKMAMAADGASPTVILGQPNGKANSQAHDESNDATETDR